jgi:quinohemoprotein ethanol dehydrogenase
VLATGGGLVFQGSTDGRLKIFDDKTGALLKKIDTGSSIMAAPMTYMIGGVQYVSVMAAWGGGGWIYPHPGDAYLKYGNMGRILTFKLGSEETPKPAKIAPPGPIPEPPAYKAFGLTGSPLQIAKGEALFKQNCSLCHSNMTGSMTPDLRRMSQDTHAAFKDIVLDGALKDAGMPGWNDILGARDADAIHAYLIAASREAYSAGHTTRK